MNKKLLTSILTVLLLSIFFFGSTIYAALFESKVEFDSEDEETSAADIMDLIDIWEIAVGRPGDGATVKSDGDNKYISTSGYLDIRSWDLIEAPYTYSVDVKLEGVGDEKVGFFVRSVLPITKVNPANQNVDQSFAYFEWDWYAENSGKNGGSSIGGSGIVVHPTTSGFILRVKNWQPDGLNTSSVKATIPVPEGVDMTKFFTLKFVDDGSKVTISVNDKTLATVEMSNPGTYEDEEDENSYFKTVSVKDAEGTELLKLDNAKVSATDSQIALGNRDTVVHLDNIYISYNVPDPTPTPVPTDTPEPTKTPSPTSDKSDRNDTDEDFNFLPIAIGAAAIVVIGVGIVLFKVSKKK